MNTSPDSPTAQSNTAQPIDRALDRWHQLIGSAPDVLAEGLNDLLADDVVFYSPVVFTPQEGKAITTAYLVAAGSALSADFNYVKELRDGNHGLLEFECTVDGKYVNGVDLISCDDAGRITAFKVLVRPLQGVNAVHSQMMAQLATMTPPATEA